METNRHEREKKVSWPMDMTPPPFKQAVNIYRAAKLKTNVIQKKKT